MPNTKQIFVFSVISQHWHGACSWNASSWNHFNSTWLITLIMMTWWYKKPGARFNIKMTSYQYKKSNCGDKMILWLAYLHNEISYTGKMTSLYWIRALGISRYVLDLVPPKHSSDGGNVLCMCNSINSLAPGKFEWNFRHLIFQIISVIDGWVVSCQLALK